MTNNLNLICEFEFKNHKATLETVKTHLAKLGVTYSTWNYSWSGNGVIAIYKEMLIGTDKCKDVLFEFAGVDLNSRLQKISCEYLSNGGVWTKGVIYSRPWYRGGNWI